METRSNLDQPSVSTPPSVFLKPKDFVGILHRDQLRVINVLRGHSRHSSETAYPELVKKFKEIGHTEEVVYDVLEYISEIAPLTINVSAINVGKLINDEYYRSAFEVFGIKANQARKSWESRCFLGLYDGVTPFERPKYGALNFMNHPEGVSSAIGYGDCHLELAQHVRKRITLTDRDTSVQGEIGVLDHCAHVLNKFHPKELEVIASIAENKIPFGKYLPNMSYREIQIHGEIKLSRDVVALHVPGNSAPDLGVLGQFERSFKVPIIKF